MDRRWLTAVICAVLFTLAWAMSHPAIDHLPTSDLYTDLSVARHLRDGDGFLNDVVYPVSLAFRFAARVPQPLIHRGPLYPLILIGPVAIGGDDPARALVAVRWFCVVIFGVSVLSGILCCLRLDRPEAILPWLLLLFFNPIVSLSIGWARVEVVAAMLLLAAWVRWRGDLVGAPFTARADRDDDRPGTWRRALPDGALIGLIALLRFDLAWVAVAWWLVAGRWRHRRALLATGAVCLLLILPWAVRNLVLTGQPFFSLQYFAEHLKQTAAWPDYSIYRSLSPEAMTTTLAEQPGVVLRKMGAGLRFFALALGSWLPWLLWIGAALLVARHLATAWRRRNLRMWLRSPLVVALMTAVLLTVLYSPFSHTVRHLLVMLPIVALEICLGAADRLRLHLAGNQLRRGAVLALGIAVVVAVTPPQATEWQSALAEAESAETVVGEAHELATAGPIFTDSAALLWASGRAGVWLPWNRDIEAEIRRLVPEMAAAPVIRTLAVAAEPATGPQSERP